MSPSRILAVDDEADFEVLLKQRFRKQIREGEFAFALARSLRTIFSQGIDPIQHSKNLPFSALDSRFENDSNFNALAFSLLDTIRKENFA